jgi:hypothetical protein
MTEPHMTKEVASGEMDMRLKMWPRGVDGGGGGVDWVDMPPR